MITYELAKKLKDAGFPQGFIHERIITYSRSNDLSSQEGLKYPTLSELIEACGDKFHSLENWNHTFMNSWRVKGGQVPYNPEKPEDFGYSVPGSTPEEVVANLYLALHGKEQ